MADFKAKMHKIRYPLGLRPRPRWKNLHRSPTPLAVFEGSTFKRRERGERRGGKVKGRKGETKRREGFEPPKILAWRPYARPLAGFKGAGSLRRGRGKGKGRDGTEREKRGRKEKGGWEESWNRAADWLRPALASGARRVTAASGRGHTSGCHWPHEQLRSLLLGWWR